jgi:mRNA-degrading endonuclease RelE of RelBE toxin-antitoxin system
MVIIAFDSSFQKLFAKIKDETTKRRIIRQIAKLKKNPEAGKPMRYTRSNTRELYISPYRLSYFYDRTTDTIIILDLYHKKNQ